eukprot:CAMPEP_0181215020 /NCGR_PEP_ID=MMETSP1096-20121128/25783_1 /TAXON_ID=156174 ORGANISM="Chrysochromulina ericina, Strain CCMP281" /NCGR_SAMPLE_ID=MMETSP1096 /ASSEMBLY_ACC=CAM_ASM_000453 /LENGTH=117 /DNA_ID=CAMNT_0023306833 /DNA_START=199 /DNA_END=552 /DNA_ORIENTATION=-
MPTTPNQHITALPSASRVTGAAEEALTTAPNRAAPQSRSTPIADKLNRSSREGVAPPFDACNGWPSLLLVDQIGPSVKLSKILLDPLESLAHGPKGMTPHNLHLLSSFHVGVQPVET